MITFETLKAYFDNIPEGLKRPDWTRTQVGIFVPSPLTEINFALEQLLESRAINSSELFFDAGFGDGRILLLTAGVHGIPSAGAEYDEGLVGFAEHHIKEIERLYIAGGKVLPITLARGYFGEDKTYSRAGIRFKDIATFYNYKDNQLQIAEKIVRQSSRGTRFLYRGGPYPRIFEGLKFEQSIEYVDPSGHRSNVLHVYRK